MHAAYGSYHAPTSALAGDLLFTPKEHCDSLFRDRNLSGTIKEPKQDLSPRIVERFKESPGAYLGLLLRELEAWLKGHLTGNKTAGYLGRSAVPASSMRTRLSR